MGKERCAQEPTKPHRAAARSFPPGGGPQESVAALSEMVRRGRGRGGREGGPGAESAASAGRGPRRAGAGGTGPLWSGE